MPVYILNAGYWYFGNNAYEMTPDMIAVYTKFFVRLEAVVLLPTIYFHRKANYLKTGLNSRKLMIFAYIYTSVQL